jgi:TPR repeat protein
MLRHCVIAVGIAALLCAASPVLAEPKVVTLGGDTTSDAGPVAACGAVAASPFEAGFEGKGLTDDEVYLDGAKTTCEAAAQASPDSIEVKAWLGRVYVLLGRLSDALPLLDEASAAGNAVAAFLLSQQLDSTNIGIDAIASDPEKAVSLLTQASDAGYPPAQAALADRYQNGNGVPQDNSEAFRLYTLAADKGIGHAAYLVGYAYHFGYGADVDYAKAMEAYQHATDLGEPAGWYGIGVLHENGNGVAQDYLKAAEALQNGADQFEKFSETELAYLYTNGLGVTQDHDKAFALLTDAAAQGYGYAKANLSLNYLYGDGTAADPARAYDLAWAASSDRVPLAEGILGYLYSEGLGTDRDLSAALSHFQNGADLGDQYSRDRIPIIQTEIACADQAGSPYEFGGHGLDFEAIDADAAIAACNAALEVNSTSVGDKVWLARAFMKAERYDDALPLLEEGAVAGNVLAETLGAELILQGKSEVTDPATALDLYQKAADKNFPPALFALGQLYEQGGPVVADPETALDWYKKARDNGYPPADQKIAELSGPAEPPSGDLAIGFGRAGPAY